MGCVSMLYGSDGERGRCSGLYILLSPPESLLSLLESFPESAEEDYLMYQLGPTGNQKPHRYLRQGGLSCRGLITETLAGLKMPK